MSGQLPGDRDLSRAPKAEASWPWLSIHCQNPSGPYKVRCQRCRGWERRAQTMAGAMGYVIEHAKLHPDMPKPKSTGGGSR